MHNVDLKTILILQCIIQPNFTSFCLIFWQCFANFFRGSMHVCMTIKISVHYARLRSENIPSTSMYHPTEFHVILSNSLEVFQTFILGVCARVHDYENPHARCGKIFQVLHCFILQNLTLFRPKDKQYFATSVFLGEK